jgi:hypothetical protein
MPRSREAWDLATSSVPVSSLVDGDALTAAAADQLAKIETAMPGTDCPH